MRRSESGQALLLLLGALTAVMLGALVLGAIARGIGIHGDRQRAADLAALAGARAMRTAYPRLFEPPFVDGRANPGHLERAAYLALARRAAEITVARNGAETAAVSFPGGGIAPMRIRVTVLGPIAVGARGARRRTVADRAVAEAELSPGAGAATPGEPGPGDYRGPLAYRQGKPMRPDVALAFDRMAAAARADGVALIVTSAYRTDAEQARLFAQHPDPKWVAPPGKSLHRLGTELDLGPASTYGWLAANARRFHFTQRYAWEPWHYGYLLSPGSASVGYGGRPDGALGSVMPSFVPERFAPAISRASQRWSVGAALLAAQIWQESRFNPFARSAAGAQGIAQFMPGTASAYGLDDPYDAPRAIDAQAHLMHDLLREFASVPLALAAYNAGPAPVRACGCIPPILETQGYVAQILGLLGGAGDPLGTGAAGMEVRLVA